MIREKDVPTSENYSLVRTMGDPMILREWVMQGLPSDSVSQENSIFTTKGYRWPLLVDPQLQVKAFPCEIPSNPLPPTPPRRRTNG